MIEHMTNGMSVSGTATRPGSPHLVGLTESADRPGNVPQNFWAGLLEAGWAARLRSKNARLASSCATTESGSKG